ncbi:MAG TPA: type IV toxin-antitoxin system AbiEi family antitoxin domain-containing protein [Acidobacteriota bacterium]|nr:type IV toxin-antitoxin system AbiEi family antitoxin domain-containing protein [Acidobacteriota bacterium]
MAREEKGRISRAKSVFRDHGGILRTSQAIREGIHPRTLYEMRDAGLIERLSRGLYRLADLPPLEDPDFVSVALKVPGGVVCLISALAFHDLTTTIPHEVYLALEKGAERPQFRHPPVRLFWFSPETFRAGIETHQIDGGEVRIYTPEKTLADCFKFRNKIGLDVALEALKRYQHRHTFNLERLIHFARICRVENVMRPYLETLV